MKTKIIILTFTIVLLLSGCILDPYRKTKYADMAIDAWFSDETLGSIRKKAEGIDEIVSKKCHFLESKSNKYVFSCELVYKEKGETVIPLSKNNTIKVYVVFMKEKGNKFDYKVYHSSSKKDVWKNDEYLNY